MAQHEYTTFSCLGSSKRLLRKIERHEKEGWELVSIQPIPCFILGGGGWLGQAAFMRRPVPADAAADGSAEQAPGHVR